MLLRCTLLYKNMSVCVIDIVENAKLPLKPTNSHLKLNDIQKPINEWLQLINTRRALGEHHFLLFVDSELILFCRLKYPPTGTVKEMTNQNFLYGTAKNHDTLILLNITLIISFKYSKRSLGAKHDFTGHVLFTTFNFGNKTKEN